MNTENINFEKLAVAIIDSFESDPMESGRREIARGMKYVLEKYNSESELKVVDSMLMTFTGWSLASLMEMAEKVSDDEVNE